MPEVQHKLVDLDVEYPIWNRFFTITPLVVVGSRDAGGDYDLAPKHMAMPLSWQNHFGFVCSELHSTYQNIRRSGEFTVSFPRPDQILLSSLAAAPRTKDDTKPMLKALPTVKAESVDALFLRDAYLFFECQLERFVDGFGDNSLIAGRIVAARAIEDAVRCNDIDDNDLLARVPLFAYVSPGRHATIAKTNSFPFPEGFRRGDER
jgi:flavin reductase (DIM6/NTAB) family NADH-FMN oxidoreductase RutF